MILYLIVMRTQPVLPDPLPSGSGRLSLLGLLGGDSSESSTGMDSDKGVKRTDFVDKNNSFRAM